MCEHLIVHLTDAKCLRIHARNCRTVKIIASLSELKVYYIYSDKIPFL